MSGEQAQTSCPVCKIAMAAHARYCGGCGSAIAPTKSRQFSTQIPDENMVGREIVGRYRISAKLGEGGMGAVYRAEQISLKREIALKVLRPELSANKDLVRRFNAEAELAAKLNHPNTVTLYDFGQDEAGALFIAMEYIEGRSLREALVHEGPLQLQRIIDIASQVCSSLSDAHTAGIIHRDLKPDNVMLSERGRKKDQVTVLDFGIAKLRDIEGDITQQPMTQVGDMLGTPQYMAPEQIRGGEIDARTDIYALGVMIYEMVTARLPFDGNSIMALLSKHLTEIPMSPIEKRPELNIHPGISNLILRCLEKRPEDRPSTMDEVEEALAEFTQLPHKGPLPSVSPQAQWVDNTTVPATVMASDVPNVTPQCAEAQNRTDQIAPAAFKAQHDTSQNQTDLISPAPFKAQHDELSNRTDQVRHKNLTDNKKQSSTWLIPVLLLTLTASGVGGYFAFIHSPNGATEKNANGENTGDSTEFNMGDWESGSSGTKAAPSLSNESLGTDFTYSDSAFGYTLKVPSGFEGDSDSTGFASFVGEVAGTSQSITTRAWRGVARTSEKRIQSELAGFLSELNITIDHAKWKTIKGIRVLHGESNSPEIGTGEFMLTRSDSLYFFVIVGGENSDDPAIAKFRNAVFLERITLPSQF